MPSDDYDFIYDEKKVTNYIEVKLNSGMALSDIKVELADRGVPSIVLDRALSHAFRDEVNFVASDHTDGTNKNKGLFAKIIMIFLFGILVVLAILLYIKFFI